MKLTTLISEWLEENGEPETKRRRGYVLAVSGIREFAYDITSVVQITELHINEADIAPLPMNYINLSRIGICGADGLIHSLASNNDFCLNPIFNGCGKPVKRPVAQTNLPNPAFVGGQYIGSQTYIASHYRNGECTGGFFGLGGGQMGTYRIDIERRQIQFGALPLNSHSIILEYLADINSVDNDFEVHPFMILALKEWINWRWLIPTKREGEIQGAYRRYVSAYQTMRRRFNSETPADWVNAMRKSNTASVRF